MYNTLAQANTYFGTRASVGTSWSGLNDTEKTAFLTTANNDLVDCGLFSFPSTATEAMRRMECEQAFFLIKGGGGIDRRAGLKAQGIESVTLGKLSERYILEKGIAIVERAYAAGETAGYLDDFEAYLVEIDRDEDEEATADATG